MTEHQLGLTFCQYVFDYFALGLITTFVFQTIAALV